MINRMANVQQKSATKIIHLSKVYGYMDKVYGFRTLSPKSKV